MAGGKKGKGRGKSNAKAEHHALKETEKKQIKKNMKSFLDDPSSKINYWNKLDPLKRPAANKLYDELISSGDYPGGTNDPDKGEITEENEETALADPDDHNQGSQEQDQGDDHTTLDKQQIRDADTEPRSTEQERSDSTHVDSTINQDSPYTALQTDAIADVKHDITVLGMLPPKSAPAATVLTRAPLSLEVGTGMVNLLNKLKNSGVDLQYPVRESFGPKPLQVITNHFQMRLDPGHTLHQYKIIPVMTGRSKRRIRLAIETVIEQCDFLSTHRDKFATDYFDTIVAWTELHNHLTTSNHKLLSGNGSVAPSTWHLITLQDGPATLSFQLKYEGLVEVERLTRHTMLDPGEANTDLQPVLCALNILVSKTFDQNPNALQLGANKFMLKTSHRLLTNGNENRPMVSNSLCTLRGYSYTAKPGAGTILLNVNAITSAFWNPVKVSEVIEDHFAFNRDYERALRGVRVYIMYDRGDPADSETFDRLNSDHARTKPIEGFGEPIGSQKFKKEDGTSEVVRDYFQKSKVLLPFNSFTY
jgi:hypothetical protein